VIDDINILCIRILFIADDELNDCTKRDVSISYSLRMIRVV